MSGFAHLYGGQANCPARPHGISPMAGDHVPKAIWVRNDGHKHISSLITRPTQAAPGAPTPTTNTTNPPTPTTMATPQIPAKRRPSYTKPSEDYSTPYKPAALIVDAAPTAAEVATPPEPQTICGIVIERGIPLPTKNASRGHPIIDQMIALVAALQPGESAELPIARKPTLGRAIQADKAARGTVFTVATDIANKTLRVWRVA